MKKTDHLLSTALQHHQSGQLQEAEKAYRAVLDLEPNHPDALHLLGVLAHQVGQSAVAVQLIHQAIQQRPDFPEAYCNMGVALKSLGQLDDAATTYELALKFRPDYAEAHYNYGLTLSLLARPQEAAEALAEAVRLHPNFADAHNNLGNVLRGLGRCEEAVAAYRKTLQLQPEHAEAYCNLGLAHLESGELAEAEDACRRAVQLRPDLREAYSNLGVVLAERGKHDEAIAVHIQAVDVAPDDPESYYNLGAALQTQRKFDEARDAYSHVLEIDPEHVQTLNNLASVLREQGELCDAISMWKRVVNLSPDFADAHGNLGVALLEDGHEEDAVDSLRQAVELNPESANLQNSLGQALQNLGQLDDAVARFERALQLDPENAQVWFRWATAKKYTPSDQPSVAKIEQLANQSDRDDNDRSTLYFALGKIHDDCEQWEAAFRSYNHANQLANVHFDAQAWMEHIDAIIAATPKTRSSVPTTSDPSAEAKPRPVFIVGMPRSGTTLVEQILASHSEVFGAGELAARGTPMSQLSATIGRHSGFPKDGSDWTGEMIETMRNEYLGRIAEVGNGASLVTDKSPGNFIYLGAIATLFPDAVIIHCRRNPMDVCLSCYFQKFTYGQEFSFSLDGLAVYYRQYERLMDHWRQQLAGRIHEVQYEELVAEQERMSRDLVTACDLPWHEACLQFHKATRSVQTASNWQVRQPIYKSSVERWRNYAPFLKGLAQKLSVRL